ncbi:MAG: tetratricopeptide repeat protein [Bacteroidales bacterium]
MNRKDIFENHELACEFIVDRQIGNALDLFYDINNDESSDDYYRNQLDKHKSAYNSILEHAFTEVRDPKQKEIYQRLQKDILETGDRLKEHVLTQKGGSSIYKTKWKLEQEIESGRIQYDKLLESLTVDKELDELLKDVDISTEENQNQEPGNRNEVLSDLFRSIWMVDKYGDEENKLIRNINNSDKLPWHDKCLFVSALTLGALRCFDEQKVELLFELYEKQEEQVWQRALVGLVFILYKFDNRIHLYPKIINRLKSLAGNQQFEKNIEAIIIQTIKSQETEELTRKWEEEILPEIIKMRPKIEQKLDLENILSEKFIEDKNPDWERVFEDSPDLMDKLQEFSKMQMEGSDVFMSAFGRLKNFPFFNRIGNWFIPFYKDNPEIANVNSGDSQVDISPLVEKLESSHYMCNSDKYSFCFNLQHIPEEQKNTLMHLFNEEMKQMQEIGEDEQLLNDFAKTKSIYAQYLQDLYRFYKLHPLKREIEDVFRYKLDIYNTNFFDTVIDNKDISRNIAEFYFERNHFDRAIELFKTILEEKNNDSEGEILEKTAYSYQRKGEYQKALDYYQKAELFDTNKAWVVKKIALCYRYLNQPESALEYYKTAEQLEPENLYIQAYIGHSLFQLKRYEEALKYYFKVEYMAPENAKIRRPIAWCSFVLSKFDTAENYINKLLEQESNYFDYITLGHVYWCTERPEDAKDAYVQAVLHKDGNFEKFSSAFLDNRKDLEDKGIEPLDINLMLDYVKFSSETP